MSSNDRDCDRIRGVAALAPSDPRHGAAERFHRGAEDSGAIVPIGDWVIRKPAPRRRHGPGTCRLAVNLSPAQFRGQTLQHTVREALRSSGIAPERLELEITETVLLRSNQATLSVLHAIAGKWRAHRDGRFRHRLFVAVLSAQLPVRHDQDRSAPSSASSQTRNECLAIVRAIAALANSLHMSTTAEGVETEEQFALLAAEGCIGDPGLPVQQAGPRPRYSHAD